MEARSQTQRTIVKPAAAIDVLNLGKRFRSMPEPALEGVTFSLAQGERLGILGPNGAGKSTLLKILSRVLSPDSGQVVLRGRVASLLELGSGFHPELSGRENVFLSGTLLGMRRSEVRRRLDEILDFSGIGEAIERPVKDYSSGMYVRLAFSVASHLDSDILLLDEVLAVGDQKFQAQCLQRIETLGRSGRSIVLVSHHLDSLERFCERALWMERGRIKLDASAAEVVQSYLDGIRLQTAGTEGVPSDLPRPGSGEWRFSKVRLSEAELPEQAATETRRGQSYVLDIECSSSSSSFERLSDLDFNINFINERAQIVGSLDSRRSQLEFTPTDLGHARLRCLFESWPFLPGEYIARARLSLAGRAVDKLEAAFVFRVMPESLPSVSRQGAVEIRALQL